MEPGSPYFRQVELLVQLLPIVARYDCFALKGGTAINLFVRDLPRLSVDIDLTYVPLKPRDEALQEIDAAFRGLQAELEQRLPGVRVASTALAGTGCIYKLVAQMDLIQVKIELSPVMRGTVEMPVLMETSPQAQERFGYAQVQVVAFNDLFAGKLCAALSRQHPRDLFDVALLLRHEGVSETLLEVFLVYLACGNKPMAEMLAPAQTNFAQAFVDEFQGMASEPVTAAMLEQARSSLVSEINAKLTDSHKQFLLSIKQGAPDWGLIRHSEAEQLPAIQWKLQNIRRMPPKKHRAALEKLERVLYG